MGRKRARFYDGLQASEHDVTSNNQVAMRLAGLSVPHCRSRFPSSADSTCNTCVCKRNDGASTRDALHVLVPSSILPLSSWNDPPQGLVFVARTCSFWAFLGSFWMKVFWSLFFVWLFIANFTVEVKYSSHFDPVLMHFDTREHFVSVSVLCCGNGFHHRDFKRI